MFGGTLNINNSTFTGNAAPSDEFRRGGSAFCVGLDATVNITSSILANSIKSDAPPVNPPYDIARYLGSLGVAPNNVINISTSLVASVAAGTLNGTTASPHFAINPLLAPLADNGGLTQTHLRLPGSPALNTGSNSQAFATDQRGAGFARMIGGTADMGAVEMPPRGAAHRDAKKIHHRRAARRGFVQPEHHWRYALWRHQSDKSRHTQQRHRGCQRQ